jgi:MSHA biogenesis protein MshN
VSLVNDMLKDLDQRRRNSDSSGARVRLTPAGEFPKSTAKIKMVYMLVALVAVVAILSLTWLQLSSNSGSRSIDLRVPDTSPFEVANQQRSTASNSELEAMGVAAPVDSMVADVEETPATAESLPEINLSNTSPAGILTQVVQQRANTQAGAIKDFSAPTPSAPAVPNVIDPLDSEVSSEEELVDLRSGAGVDESIINEAAISEDQQDTMAVQRSLRLIADNKVAEAYANFATHINENRYAHQSRETYAKLLVNDGQLDAAYQLIAEGLELAPNNAGFKKVKARVLIRNGRLLDAVELLVAKAPQVAEDVEYHEILASVQLAVKDFAGAAISYSELVGVDQTQGKYWYGYAAAQELLGNTKVARQAYSRAAQQANLSTNLRRRSQDRLLALRE